MSTPVKLTIIGAGSAAFSLAIFRDMCATEELAGSLVTFVDIDQGRLDSIHKMAERYAEEVGADISFEKTTNRQAALKDTDFVINTALNGGHGNAEELRAIAEEYGYYRGFTNRGHWGGTRIPFVHGHHQYKLMMDVARDMELICPDAWLIQASNPVFEGTTLMNRETDLKIIGLCHGHYGYKEVAKVIGFDPERVKYQAPGFNHLIYLTTFEYDGKDAYPILDQWLKNEAEEYWKTYEDDKFGSKLQMSRAALKQYELFGVMPIGDTVRKGFWQFHYSLETKQKWYNPMGGFDSDLGWNQYLENGEKRIKKIFDDANDLNVKLTEEYPPGLTGEQHVPIINSLVNNIKGEYQVNVMNDRYLKAIPDNVVVEVPATIDADGIHVGEVDQLPPTVLYNVLYPEMIKMESSFYAFKTGDKRMVELMMLNDPRTKTIEQAEEMLEAVFDHLFNKEIAEYYGYK